MKYKTLIIFLSSFLFACTNNTERADAYGNFEVVSVIVSAESSGKISQLNVNEGQQIKAGFTAAIIDTIQLHLKVQQTDAQKAAVDSRRSSINSQIDVLKEQKINLRVNENRTKRMLKDGASTQKTLDDIQGQISVIDKQIASTETQFVAINAEKTVLNAQKDLLRDQLKRCEVKSPISGTILETYAEQGELTMPGKSLFKIADLSELELKIYVSGAQLPSIKLNQNVDVLIDKTATETQTLSGKITWISSEAEFTPKIIQTKKERVKLVYAVKVTVKNNGLLKIGMPGEVNF